MSPLKSPLKKLSLPLFILAVAIIGSLMPVLETFAAINRTSYQYAVSSCTEGSDLQKERCKDQSAEAMVYRMHKGIKGTDPTNPLYETWVAKLKTGAANSKPIDLAILVAETTTTNNQDYLEDLYQNFLCRTAAQEATAIAQWKSQLDGNKQTRAQIALHLAKRPASMGCMRTGFFAFLQANPPVDPDPDPEPSLADVSVTCTTQVGQSCSIPAPQYCLSGFVTQPANGTSTITAGNIVYTPNGNDPAEENYAHLRQNGTATAKCNVKVVFESAPDNGKRFHITFLGIGFEGHENEFQDKVNVYKSVFIDSRPLAKYSDKIVFHDAIASNTSSASFNCTGGVAADGSGGFRAVFCDEPTVDSWLNQNGIPGDRVIGVRRSTLYGGASTTGGALIDASGNPHPLSSLLGGGKFSFVNTGSDSVNGALPGNTALHEFSHSMGLNDEYLYEPGPDEPGDAIYREGQCVPMDPGPNWRTVVPFTSTWWDEWKDVPDSPDPRANTNWHKGCGYNKFYRPSASSIMSTNVWYYNDISAHLIDQTLKSYLD